jgi:hypothetical protein
LGLGLIDPGPFPVRRTSERGLIHPSA